VIISGVIVIEIVKELVKEARIEVMVGIRIIGRRGIANLDGTTERKARILRMSMIETGRSAEMLKRRIGHKFMISTEKRETGKGKEIEKRKKRRELERKKERRQRRKKRD
jgi:hypothetical protein